MAWILRMIFFWIDSAVFSLIGNIYNLFIDIAETSVISQDLIAAFGSRIYALLGIFMLFKVSFSVLNYIVNPDDFTDKSKGFSKIISNILISLTLLVAVPWIFDKAFQVQRIILRDNVIGNLILGSSGGISSNISAINPGRTMGYANLKAFYYLDEELYPGCEGIYFSGPTDMNACISQAFDNDDKANSFIDSIVFSAQSRSVSMYLNPDLVFAKDANDNYTMTYTPLISTASGVCMILLLLVFCFDIAVRSIKLGFLQLMAPIPIISRIDPKSAKDGMFSKWVKLCTKTFLDLFVRLLAIYFAVFIISNIVDAQTYNVVTGETESISGLVKVFIILGALLFAKAVPKMIEDLLGIKMEGSFSLNPMNKLRQVPLVGTAVTGAGALAGGAITGGIAGKEAGHVLRGAWQGMMGARQGIAGKVPLMGDTSGKNPHAFKSGLQSGYKTIKGKDYEIWSPWKQVGKGSGEDEVNDLKKSKYSLYNAQARLDADLQKLYDEYKNPNTDAKRKAELPSAIEGNRKSYNEYNKHIGVIDDQIKDIKRLYKIDDSPQADLSKALDEAKTIEEANSKAKQSAVGSEPTKVTPKPVNNQEQKNKPKQ